MLPEHMKLLSLENEYKKKTSVTPQDIAKLREWLKTQPHLPEKHITDMDLILAYHCCNCSRELSKQVLDLNFTLRTLFTAYFKDRKVDAQVEQTAKDVLMAALPTRTKEGHKIFYTRYLNTDPKIYNFERTLRVSLMLVDIYQAEEGTWPAVQVVFDLVGMSIGHLAKIDLQNMQRYLYYVQEAVPLKLLGIHYINAPSFMDKILMLMKPFMKKELGQILHVHIAGSKTIEKFMPIEALPKEAGGKYKSCTELSDDTVAKLKDYKEYFEKENEKRVTESLRPGKPKTISDIFGGVEGSFKKLDID